MTPTSLMGGLFVGLLDGAIIGLAVMTVLMLVNRRHKGATVRHPVAEDHPVSSRLNTPDDSVASHLRNVA